MVGSISAWWSLAMMVCVVSSARPRPSGVISGAVADLYSHGKDGLDLPVQHVAGEAVAGDPGDRGADGVGSGLEKGDLLEFRGGAWYTEERNSEEREDHHVH